MSKNSGLQEKVPLGNSDLLVTRIGLGTMTWGQQNTQDEGFAQMDLALERGVNFLDTAEMYSVPAYAETYGATETIIGNWFASRGTRDRVVLATKVIGRSPGLRWIRGDKGNGLDRANIIEAVEGSLRRLRTDYIDLYQFHWPDRQANFFGKLGYVHEAPGLGTPDTGAPRLQESLVTVAELIRIGKIRHWGVSNETPWGLMKYLQLADSMGLPRPITIQNPYSLLNRTFEVGLAEIAHREKVGLLAYSPLGFGILTGKYDGLPQEQWPPQGRLTLFGHTLKRYLHPRAMEAARRCNALAREYGLSPSAMALAWVRTRAFTASTLIGATDLHQLQENLDSATIDLPATLLEALEEWHREFTFVAP